MALRSAKLHKLFGFIESNVTNEGRFNRKQGFYELVRKIIDCRRSIECLANDNTVGVLVDNHKEVMEGLCECDGYVRFNKNVYEEYMKELVALICKHDGCNDNIKTETETSSSAVVATNNGPRKIEITLTSDSDVKVNTVKRGDTITITLVF